MLNVLDLLPDYLYTCTTPPSALVAIGFVSSSLVDMATLIATPPSNSLVNSLSLVSIWVYLQLHFDLGYGDISADLGKSKNSLSQTWAHLQSLPH
ncbi:hypothetical protein DL93DRAFT_2174641 [Clavulina sp. PMI_390]|nr:hypothetical protein DL93DRAFT_2174641 [Clavulina sp. PMI_390]